MRVAMRACSAARSAGTRASLSTRYAKRDGAAPCSADSGLPVNATGSLHNTVDVDGPFDGAVELGKKLAGSAQVRVCVTKQWYRYALGLGETELDSCALKSAVEGFKASGDKFSELLVAVVSSDAFRRRTVIAP